MAAMWTGIIQVVKRSSVNQKATLKVLELLSEMGPMNCSKRILNYEVNGNESVKKIGGEIEYKH